MIYFCLGLAAFAVLAPFPMIPPRRRRPGPAKAAAAPVSSTPTSTGTTPKKPATNKTNSPSNAYPLRSPERGAGSP